MILYLPRIVSSVPAAEAKSIGAGVFASLIVRLRISWRCWIMCSVAGGTTVFALLSRTSELPETSLRVVPLHSLHTPASNCGGQVRPASDLLSNARRPHLRQTYGMSSVP